jgi:hypothetical protein
MTNFELIKSFRRERISQICSDNFNLSLCSGAKVILHLIPENFVDNEEGCLKLDSGIEILQTNIGSDLTRWNYDGIIAYNENEGNISNYVQVFRNGVIESVSGRIFEEDEKEIPCIGYEQELMASLERYMRISYQLKVEVPIYVFLTFTDIKGYKILANRRYKKDFPIDRDVLYLPGKVINSYSEMADELLHPMFDRIWNACGHERSYNFDEDGNWIRK